MSTDDTDDADDVVERGPTGTVVYREQPRSYREVALISLVIVVGFGIDLAFDVHGAVTHLPGWIVALVLVAGIDALLVVAARSTRLLTVTTDELWVGDEMVSRADILGVVPPETSDLPTLGWPNGRPGKARGVALRLADDREVLVPSRHSARLAAALGTTTVAAREPARVRDASEADLDLLPEIDERSEVVFRLTGIDLPEIAWTVPADPVAVLVADDPPVGFVVLTVVDGLAHVDQIAVLPRAMRSGIGTRLLEAACVRARDGGYVAITLSTFADVAWNGPWYRSRGFRELDERAELTPELAALRDTERELGLDDAGRRIAMRREF